ncbi:hypothetical protein HK414_10300 [Ramlibacter terrae]|uniref:Translesion DNA synthesis-associated protein ImuA n=1 Tax=Ramlibacter terrae TaxID=2732511 RepID=A0ABX6P1Z9_9BURK|nr:hypothetical protein HK414_10300 [Ramlibacter terrae]
MLQQQPHQFAWQLMAPALRERSRVEAGPIVLVNPPYLPFGPGLRGLDLRPEQLLCVQSEKVAARLWATEQALRCADVAAVLAGCRRRATKTCAGCTCARSSTTGSLVAFRGVDARDHSSPARVRLLVEGAQQMEVRILKRRGPPLLQPLVLRAQPPRLAALLAARKRRLFPQPSSVPTGASHVLDRTATFAG